jgi:hypothetical protein
MNTIYYIVGEEAVNNLEESFENFAEYFEEHPDCLRSHNYETENEMRHFVSGLEEMGYEKYSILTEEEAKKLNT